MSTKRLTTRRIREILRLIGNKRSWICRSDLLQWRSCAVSCSMCCPPDSWKSAITGSWAPDHRFPWKRFVRWLSWHSNLASRTMKSNPNHRSGRHARTAEKIWPSDATSSDFHNPHLNMGSCYLSNRQSKCMRTGIEIRADSFMRWPWPFTLKPHFSKNCGRKIAHSIFWGLFARVSSYRFDRI